MYLGRRGEEHMTSSRRSQPGGRGKQAGRSIKRTMQLRKGLPRRLLLAETGGVVRRLGNNSRKSGIIVRIQREGTVDHRSRVDGMHGKHGSESREGLAGRLGAPAQRRRCV